MHQKSRTLLATPLNTNNLQTISPQQNVKSYDLILQRCQRSKDEGGAETVTQFTVASPDPDHGSGSKYGKLNLQYFFIRAKPCLKAGMVSP